MGEAKRKKHGLKGSAADVSTATGQQITLPERVLNEFSTRYKDVWKYVDLVRHDPQEVIGISGWEPWCYLPINAAAGILAHLKREEMSSREVETFLHQDVRLLSALAAWRMTKGVYAMDATLLQEIFDSDQTDSVPDELFLHLPEWCVYVATPGLTAVNGLVLHGFFAFVEDHVSHGRTRPPELHFQMVVDVEASDPSAIAAIDINRVDQLKEIIGRIRDGASSLDEVLPVGREFIVMGDSIELGHGSFAKAFSKGFEEMQRTMGKAVDEFAPVLDENDARMQILSGFGKRVESTGKETLDQVFKFLIDLKLRLASILLYLCSEDPDISRPTAHSQSMEEVRRKQRQGIRTFEARGVAKWDVGFRIGAKIREFQASASGESTGTGSKVRPHVRRAHWHSFWAGPRSEPEKRQRRVRWLPPIPINVDAPSDLVPTVHVVERPSAPQH